MKRKDRTQEQTALARKCLISAAGAHELHAVATLADCYYNGDRGLGFSKDIATAKDWYSVVLLLDDLTPTRAYFAHAAYHVGRIESDQYKNHRAAVEMYEKATMHEGSEPLKVYKKALNCMGLLFLDGAKGVKQAH